MAEIRSTMDLVMERLKKMDLDSAPDLDREEAVHEGMRLGAAFMRGDNVDLARPLADRSAPGRDFVRKGIVQALLRNITLPREEDQKEAADRAVDGLLAIGGKSGELADLFRELRSILGRSLEHRKQMRKQLEEAFAMQMQQMEAALAKQTGVSMKLQPSQHPKFQEEWQRLQDDLNDQYGRAVEQYREHIRQRLGV